MADVLKENRVAAMASIGKYTVLGPLGKGAHSTIFHVRRAADSREYALKIVSVGGADEVKFLDQAKHEFRIAQMLDHPHLIKIHALELKRDWLFRVRTAHMLIEYVNGKTLDAVPLTQEQLIPAFAHIAAGMAHMHRRGVFHGDMKPNNVLFGKRGEVKVIDYGLAWVKGEKKDRVQGTPEYMAPETARHKTVNERSDIYNFGATMYRLTTHQLPPMVVPTGESLRMGARAFNQMLQPVGTLNKAAPKALCDLIHWCLNYDADRRPERMGQVLDELKKIARESGNPISDDE